MYILTRLKILFTLGLSEEKIKTKAGGLLFFFVGHHFFMSEDSLTVKYSEWPNVTFGGINVTNIKLR